MFLWGLNDYSGRSGNTKSDLTMAILEINVYTETKGIDCCNAIY